MVDLPQGQVSLFKNPLFPGIYLLFLRIRQDRVRNPQETPGAAVVVKNPGSDPRDDGSPYTSSRFRIFR